MQSSNANAKYKIAPSEIHPDSIIEEEPRGQVNPAYRDDSIDERENVSAEVHPRRQHSPRKSRFEKMTRFYSMRMNTHRNGRNEFVKKVYSILCGQFLINCLFVAAVLVDEGTREEIKENIVLVCVCAGLVLLLLILIFCCQTISRRVPYNYLALLTLTLLEGYVLAFICAFYDPEIVFIAVAMSLGLVSVLTAYACYTKTDFTTKRGIILVVMTSNILFGCSLVFFSDSWLNLLFCLIGVIAFGSFIVYDTQLVAGGRHDELNYDDYIIAALVLYVDIVGLFVYMLRLVGEVTDEF